MAQALVELLRSEFPQAVVASSSQHGDETVIIDAASWVKVHRFLRDDERCQMQMLTDLTAVDYPDRDPRFEVVTHLHSLSKGHRLRVKTRVGDPAGEKVEAGSLTELWGSANWLERECFDMLGVHFIGHPDLRRILMYPEFEGHPLRKDYAASHIQPLLAYRDAPNIEKLPPFDRHEGMSFGRQTHDGFASEEDDALSRKRSH